MCKPVHQEKGQDIIHVEYDRLELQSVSYIQLVHYRTKKAIHKAAFKWKQVLICFKKLCLSLNVKKKAQYRSVFIHPTKKGMNVNLTKKITFKRAEYRVETRMNEV